MRSIMTENKILRDPSPLFGSIEWIELEKREFEIGPEQLLAEIINQKTWSNVEILWILKRLVYYYGKKDSLLKKAPQDRLITNMVDVLRAFYVIFDITAPELDENLRSYVCTKLADATGGISSPSRDSLRKI
jgi:hypothetical protein